MPERFTVAWPPTTTFPVKLDLMTWLSSLPWFQQILKEEAARNNIEASDAFRSWLLNAIVSDPNYDYRKAYEAGVEPQINPYDNLYHWPSKTPTEEWLKGPNHPTRWKEGFLGKYGVDPDSIGFGFGASWPHASPIVDKLIQMLPIPKASEDNPKMKEAPGDLNEPFRQNWLHLPMG